MADFTIIDRRKNQKDKSLSNRQRFIDRVKKQVKDSANKKMDSRSITDQGGADVTISKDGIGEPRFSHDSSTGEHDFVIPGNADFLAGDKIKKPPQQGGGGRGTEGSPDGEGEDDFQFTLSRDEYLDIIFDGLELPDMTKEAEAEMVQVNTHRAGYTTSGMPSNLNVERTAIAGLSRRIALKSPKMRVIRELEAELEKTEDEDRRAELLEEIRVLRIRANAVRFLDNVDMRFNNFVQRPEPVTRACMICVMDVSASMGEQEKLIAKKFFVLLYRFLMRKYEKIEVVFVRHHTEAQEVDEETFFNDRTTGGTVVSTAYVESLRIIEQRYPAESWNLYMAQASDGDNDSRDNDKVVHLLKNKLLPMLQYMVYIEIMRNSHYDYSGSIATLWDHLDSVSNEMGKLTCTKIGNENEIVSAFRNLFKQKAS